MPERYVFGCACAWRGTSAAPDLPRTGDASLRDTSRRGNIVERKGNLQKKRCILHQTFLDARTWLDGDKTHKGSLDKTQRGLIRMHSYFQRLAVALKLRLATARGTEAATNSLSIRFRFFSFFSPGVIP